MYRTDRCTWTAPHPSWEFAPYHFDDRGEVNHAWTQPSRLVAEWSFMNLTIHRSTLHSLQLNGKASHDYRFLFDVTIPNELQNLAKTQGAFVSHLLHLIPCLFPHFFIRIILGLNF